jgi:hypothetical protein
MTNLPLNTPVFVSPSVFTRKLRVSVVLGVVVSAVYFVVAFLLLPLAAAEPELVVVVVTIGFVAAAYVACAIQSAILARDFPDVTHVGRGPIFVFTVLAALAVGGAVYTAVATSFGFAFAFVEVFSLVPSLFIVSLQRNAIRAAGQVS